MRKQKTMNRFLQILILLLFASSSSGCGTPMVDAKVRADVDAKADVLTTSTSAAGGDMSGGDKSILVGPVSIQGGAWLTAVTGAVCIIALWRWGVNRRRFRETVAGVAYVRSDPILSAMDKPFMDHVAAKQNNDTQRVAKRLNRRFVKKYKP